MTIQLLMAYCRENIHTALSLGMYLIKESYYSYSKVTTITVFVWINDVSRLRTLPSPTE